MATHDLVVIGGSAGGLAPVLEILSGLGSGYSGAICITLHTSPDSHGALPQILSRSTPLICQYASDGEKLQRGRVYLPPPDRHLMIGPGELNVTQGPRENGFRPAVDPLFRTAAQFYAQRVIGVIVSGALDDGTFGMSAIKKAGGLAIVQHPHEATASGMPLSAIQNVEVDHIVKAREIAPLLQQFAGSSPLDQALAPVSPTVTPNLEKIRDLTLCGAPPDGLAEAQGLPTVLCCPDCGGTLWEIQEGTNFRFRCHTGHGFTAETLMSGQALKLEQALWTAIRVLQERSTLHRQMAQRSHEQGMVSLAEKYSERAQRELEQSQLLREFFGRLGTSAPLLRQNLSHS